MIVIVWNFLWPFSKLFFSSSFCQCFWTTCVLGVNVHSGQTEFVCNFFWGGGLVEWCGQILMVLNWRQKIAR